MTNFKCFIIAVLAFRGTFYVNSFEEFDKQINFSSEMLMVKSALLPAKEFMTLFLSLFILYSDDFTNASLQYSQSRNA